MSMLRAVARGQAAHAVLCWIHRKPVPDILLLNSPSFTEAAPRERCEVEEGIRTALAAPAAEMMHLNTGTTHISRGRPDVEHALRLEHRVDANDPIGAMEKCLDDTHATLQSPRIHHAIGAVAAALMKSPRGVPRMPITTAMGKVAIRHRHPHSRMRVPMRTTQTTRRRHPHPQETTAHLSLRAGTMLQLRLTSLVAHVRNRVIWLSNWRCRKRKQVLASRSIWK
jgi:hypothetical protein